MTRFFLDQRNAEQLFLHIRDLLLFASLVYEKYRYTNDSQSYFFAFPLKKLIHLLILNKDHRLESILVMAKQIKIVKRLVLVLLAHNCNDEDIVRSRL